MNKRATGIERSKRKKAVRNRTAMTVHTSSAVAVQRVIAQLISFARRDRVARSVRSAGWSSVEALSSLSSNTRARSMMRPNLFVITIRIAPMPERRKPARRPVGSRGLRRRPKNQAQTNAQTRLADNLETGATRRCLGVLQSRINFLGRERQIEKSHADGVFDRIGDSGCCWNVGNFSDCLTLIRSWAGGVFH